MNDFEYPAPDPLPPIEDSTRADVERDIVKVLDSIPERSAEENEQLRYHCQRIAAFDLAVRYGCTVTAEPGEEAPRAPETAGEECQVDPEKKRAAIDAITRISSDSRKRMLENPPVAGTRHMPTAREIGFVLQGVGAFARSAGECNCWRCRCSAPGILALPCRGMAPGNSTSRRAEDFLLEILKDIAEGHLVDAGS